MKVGDAFMFVCLMRKCGKMEGEVLGLFGGANENCIFGKYISIFYNEVERFFFFFGSCISFNCYMGYILLSFFQKEFGFGFSVLFSEIVY